MSGFISHKCICTLSCWSRTGRWTVRGVHNKGQHGVQAGGECTVTLWRILGSHSQVWDAQEKWGSLPFFVVILHLATWKVSSPLNVPAQCRWCRQICSCTFLLIQVLVFDFGTEFYLWQGKAVSMEQRKLGLKLAKQLYEKGYDYTESVVNPVSPLRSKLSKFSGSFGFVKTPWWMSIQGQLIKVVLELASWHI